MGLAAQIVNHVVDRRFLVWRFFKWEGTTKLIELILQDRDRVAGLCFALCVDLCSAATSRICSAAFLWLLPCVPA